jgi:hypothetical protein
MHVALSRNETHQNFNIWVYGEKNLVRGSGLFIGKTGRYQLQVFAHLLGDNAPTRLFSQTLEIPSEVAALLAEPDAGLYFDWGPDSAHYLLHVENRPPSPDPATFLELLGLTENR